MPTLVTDKLTPLELEDAIRAFADGWSIATKTDPKPQQLAVLVAHTILECGYGYKSLHWYNFGNEKASSSYRGKYCMYRCSEIDEHGHEIWYDPPHPTTWFRAFEPAAEGASEHVNFLACDSDGDGKNIYAQAWNMCLACDADGFVRAMKRAGYFTGNVDAYARATVSISAKIESACAKILNDEHHGITDEDRSHVEQQVAMWLSEEADRQVEPFPLPDGPKDIA